MNYTIGNHNGTPFITCEICGLKSVLARDIKEKYCGNCHTFHEDTSLLRLWVIYDHPDDFPDKFVARCWVLDMATSDYLFADSLEELRAMLPFGLTHLPRHLDDDPKIVETWL